MRTVNCDFGNSCGCPYQWWNLSSKYVSLPVSSTSDRTESLLIDKANHRSIHMREKACLSPFYALHLKTIILHCHDNSSEFFMESVRLSAWRRLRDSPRAAEIKWKPSAERFHEEIGCWRLQNMPCKTAYQRFTITWHGWASVVCFISRGFFRHSSSSQTGSWRHFVCLPNQTHKYPPVCSPPPLTKMNRFYYSNHVFGGLTMVAPCSKTVVYTNDKLCLV